MPSRRTKRFDINDCTVPYRNPYERTDRYPTSMVDGQVPYHTIQVPYGTSEVQLGPIKGRGGGWEGTKGASLVVQEFRRGFTTDVTYTAACGTIHDDTYSNTSAASGAFKLEDEENQLCGSDESQAGTTGPPGCACLNFDSRTFQEHPFFCFCSRPLNSVDHRVFSSQTWTVILGPLTLDT